MWGRIGEDCLVPSVGQNRRAPVFGALDALTGRVTFLLTSRKRSVEFIAFLKHLLRRYQGRHVFLFLDNCSIHHSKVVRRFLVDHARELTPIWNAPYAPELNRIERYWGHLKAKAIHNYYFGTLDNLKTAIREAIHALNRSRELKMTVSFDILHPLRKAA
jgi:transposase